MNNVLLITLNFDAAKPLRGALKNRREASLSATKSTGDGHHASYPMQQPGPHATPTASSCTPIPLSPLLSPQPQPRWPACMQHHFRGVHLRSKKQGCSGPVPYHSMALRMPRQRPECCASTRQLNSTTAPSSRIASSALIIRTVRLLQVFAAFIFLSMSAAPPLWIARPWSVMNARQTGLATSETSLTGPTSCAVR